MKKPHFLFLMILAIAISCSGKPSGRETTTNGAFSDEEQAFLGRGTVSFIENRGHVLLSWRLLPEDPKGVSFNIYRKEIGSGDENYKPIARTDRTSYVDNERERTSICICHTAGTGRKGREVFQRIHRSSPPSGGKPRWFLIWDSLIDKPGW